MLPIVKINWQGLVRTSAFPQTSLTNLVPTTTAVYSNGNPLAIKNLLSLKITAARC